MKLSHSLPRGFFFLAPILFSLFAWAVFDLKFETNDDVGMALLTSGTGIVSHPTGLLVFSSGVLVGAPLAFLYGIIPGVPWYSIYVCSLFLGAAWLLGLAITRLSRSPLMFASWVALLIGVGLPLCHRIHYTTGAFALGLSAIAILLTRLAHPGKDKKRIARDVALSAAALVISHAARDRVSPMLFAFVIAVTLPFILTSGGEIKKRLIVLVTTLLCAATGIVALELADRAYFDRDGWREARQYDRLRAGIADYEYLPDYASVGWNENDYRLFKYDFSWDEDRFSIDKLRTLNRGLVEHRPPRQSRWLRYLWRSNWNDPRTSLTLLVILTGMVLLVALRASLPIWGIFFGGVSCTAAAIGYLILSWRLPPWVFQSLLLLAAGNTVVSVGFALRARSAPAPRSAFALVLGAIALLFSLSAFLLTRESASMTELRTRAQDARRELSQLNPKAILVWGASWPFESAPVFGPMADWVPPKTFWIGCYTRLPFNRARLAELGGKDLYPYLLEKDVYLVAPRRPDIGERVAKFLEERKGIRARAVRVSGNEFYDLYRFEK